MSEKSKDIKAIFSEALEKKTAKQQAVYLDKACGNDRNLRSKVEGLLKAHKEAGDFLEVPALEPDVTMENSALIEGPGMMIGRYKLLELIGEGGMGLVYLAEQKEPVRRQVALKIIKPGMDSRQVIARFEAERQMVALLDHPNIARVLDAGTTETGRPYFVMEYVKGMTITKYCDQHKLDIEKRLKLFRQVCEAVHHAHQKGIIHRDIKPSNVLVSVQDDRAVPKIIDFGIAKAVTQPLTEQTLFTRQGQLLGTPEYMSPEQADMANQDIDTRADLYSLGVVLYELLTGVLPFEHEALEKVGFAELQRILQEEEPPRPSLRLTALGEEAERIAERRHTQVVALARRLHRELEWIPLKAMRKDRSRRYRSASELADDIQNYLSGAPLIAGPETAIYRVKKFVRKHAGSVATVILVAVALILGFVISTTMYFRAEQARRNESVARTRAEEAEKVAEERAEDYRRSLYFNRIALGDLSYRDGTIRRVRELLEACPADLRGWEWYRLNHISDQACMTLRGHTAGVSGVAVSPDGKRIVSSSGRDIRIWDAASGAELMTIRGRGAAVVFSPDGKRIVSGSRDKTIKVWDADTGAEVMTLRGHEERVTHIRFSPDGKRIVSASYGKIKLWDAVTGDEVRTFHVTEDEDSDYSPIAVSPDGKHIVLCQGRAVRVLDATTGDELVTLTLHRRVGWVTSVAFSPDGKRIILGNFDGTIKALDTATGNEVMTLQAHEGMTHHVAFSPDGRYIVSGGYDGKVKVWDVTTGFELMTLRGHEGPVRGAVFSPDCKRIVSSSRDKTIKVWDITLERDRMHFGGYQVGGLWSVAFSPDSNHIISGSEDKTIKVWDSVTGAELMTLRGHDGGVTSAAFSPDGNSIVSGSKDKTVKVWDTVTGAEVMTLRGHNRRVWSVAISPNGERIASSSWDKTIKVWNASTGADLLTLGHDSFVNSVAFSPDGRCIASGSDDHTVKVWDASTGDELMVLRENKGGVASVAYSLDGKRIASCGWENSVKVWDAATGDELMNIYGGTWWVFCVTFSPDGKLIVGGGGDGKIRLWDSTTGDEVMTLRGHSAIVNSVVFSPDGKRIVSSSAYDRTIRLWDVASGAEAMTLRGGSWGTGGIAFSPDGETIAMGCKDGNIRLFESTVSATGYESRRIANNARKIVERLYKEHGSYNKVIEALRSDTTLDRSVRQVALEIADSCWEDAGKLIEESWEVVSLTTSDTDSYRKALENAEQANRLEPNTPDILTALGAAQYRVGAYQDAAETLYKADKIQTDARKESGPAKMAFMAMALYRLGRTKEAQSTLDQLHSLFEDEQVFYDEEARSFLIQAEQVFAGGNPKLYSIWEHINNERFEEAVDLVEGLRLLQDTKIAASMKEAAKWLARVYYDRGNGRFGGGPEYAARIRDFEIAVRIDPNHAAALDGLAWVRAACLIAELRDGHKAVQAATKACQLTDWKKQDYVGTLAAAYSEAGDFASAVKWQQRAIDLLPEGQRSEWQAIYEERLKVYHSGKPYHQGDLWSFSTGKMVAWWKLDEAKDGYVIDSSNNNLRGKLLGDAHIVPDPEREKVLSLDGEGDYVDCGKASAFDITGSITIACWMKVRTPDKDHRQIIVAKDSSWWIKGSNNIDFGCRLKKPEGSKWSGSGRGWNANVGKDVNVNDGHWHHIAGVYDGTKIYLYLDGVLDDYVHVRGNLSTSDYPAFIGGNAKAPGKAGWNGLIDDVRIYSYALSEDEIKALYAGQGPGPGEVER